jgi:hypothetical protein
MELYEVESRVAAGAAWMDEKAPGWEDQVNILTLDIGIPFVCVLGQVFGRQAPLHTNGYYWALLNLMEGNSRLSIKLGFNALEAEYEERMAEMPVLTEAWRRLIVKRAELALAA